MKRLIEKIIIFLAIFLPSKIYSQVVEAKETLDIGSDLYSRYIWRGQQFGGNSPSIQPYINFDFKNFEFGLWGAYSISGKNTGQEFDTHISYSFLDQMFTTTLTDYFFPDNTNNYNYFNYLAASTGHILEGTIKFNGTEKIPISFMAAVNFYGADAARIESNASSPEFNQKIGIQYSNYFELAYSGKIEGVGINGFLGFTLNRPKAADMSYHYIGENGFYGNKPGIVNLGFELTKRLKISDRFALPVHTTVVSNPETKKVYFIVGISF
jgi:hypothetical protein